MAETLALAIPEGEDASIHPQAMLGSTTGADIAALGAALISLHAKHFGCVSVAKKLFGEVSVVQSLAIWGPGEALEESISIMSNCPAPVVQTVFNTLAMTSELAKSLAVHSTPLIPLLFDLGHGFVLRPVSCLTRNSFAALITQHTERSLRDFHSRLLEEYRQVPNVQPMPVLIRVAGATLHIHDLWNRTEMG
jgi:hypothetical protein